MAKDQKKESNNEEGKLKSDARKARKRSSMVESSAAAGTSSQSQSNLQPKWSESLNQVEPGPSTSITSHTRSKVEVFNYEIDTDEESDGELSEDAKRIMIRRQQEREEMKRLGSLVPIETSMDELKSVASRSSARPIPLRTKHNYASDLSLATTHASLKSIVSVTTSIDPDDPRERKSSLYNPGLRVTKSVSFGTVNAREFVGEFGSSQGSSRDSRESPTRDNDGRSVSEPFTRSQLIGQRAFDENVAAETRQQVFDDLRKALERDPHPHPSHSNSHERDKHDSNDSL